MKSTEEIAGYRYEDAEVNASHAYLLPALRAELARLGVRDKRLFDLGCGNGSVGAVVHAQDGWAVTDIRFLRVGRVPVLAKSMIAIARKPG